MFNYSLVAGVLLYFLMVQLLAKGIIKPVAAGVLVTVGSVGFSWLLRALTYHAYKIPLSQLLTLLDIVAAVLTLVITIIVFSKMVENEESYTAWLLYGAAGAIGAFYIMPSILGLFT